MKLSSFGRSPLLHRLSGLVLLALALAIYFLGVVRIDLQATSFSDLSPDPDGAEYFAGAMALAQEGQFKIHVAGQDFPPRYPFGYSLLMVPLLKMGLDPVQVPFRVNQLCGLLLLAAVFSVLWKERLWVAAGLSPLILVTLPIFLIAARSPMSEMSGTLVLFAAHDCLFLGIRRRKPTAMLMGGLLMGISTCFRISNLFYGGALVVAPLLLLVGSWRKRFVWVLGCLATFCLGLLPLLIYQYSAFGTPIGTGYGLWVPTWGDPRNAFNPYYFPYGVDYYGREVIQQEVTYTVANVFGEGSYFGPAILLLLLLSLWNLRKHRVVWVFGLSMAAVLGAHLVYFYRDARLIFPLFVMATPVIAAGTVRFCRQATRRWQVVGVGVVLLAHLSMFPGHSGDPDLGRYLKVERWYRSANRYQLVQRFNAGFDGNEVLILTDLCPPYVYALTSGRRQVSPLNSDHRYGFNPHVLMFGRAEQTAQIEQAVAAAKPTWVIAERNLRASLDGVMLPDEDWHWDVVWEPEWGGGIARLVMDVRR